MIIINVTIAHTSFMILYQKLQSITMLFYNYRRPGSLRAVLSAGTASAPEEKTTLRGLRTRAVPAGVTTLRSPGLVRYID